MIVRYPVACMTCTTPHTLRIQIGHEDYQEHAFQCTECGEQMVIGMRCDQAKGSYEIVDKDNCQAGEIEGKVINLSPDFPIPADELHKDMAFPSGPHVQQFMAAQLALGIGPIPAKDYLNVNPALLRRPSNLWPILDKAWSLDRRGRDELANEKIAQYFNTQETTKQLADALYDFCRRMLSVGRVSLYKDAAAFSAKAYAEHKSEFLRFQNHYKANVRQDNLERHHETLKEYFSCFTDFSQTFTHAQFNIELAQDYEASSSAFSKTKLFYGNAYENLTTNVATLACINNISAGRRFDEFLTMDLKQYLTINKANRCTPFKDVVPLMNIGKCLDSTIRNASHHGGMKLVNNGRTIQYRSGGNGAQRTMSYLEYIKACNEMVLSTCALLALELFVMQDA